MAGEYTSNVASGVFGGVVSGASMGGGVFSVPGAVIGGFLGLGKALIENKAGKEREAKVAKQKKALKQRRKQVEGELTGIPDLLEQKQDLQEEQLEYQSQSVVENFIEQTVGNIQGMETTKGKTGLTSSDIDTQITSSKEKSSKSFNQVMTDLERQKENLEYATEAEKASRVQSLIGDLYDLDTTIEGL